MTGRWTQLLLQGAAAGAAPLYGCTRRHRAVEAIQRFIQKAHKRTYTRNDHAHEHTRETAHAHGKGRAKQEHTAASGIASSRVELSR